MMTGVQDMVTNKHATYLEVPPLGFEPRTDFRLLQRWKLVFQLVPGGHLRTTKITPLLPFPLSLLGYAANVL